MTKNILVIAAHPDDEVLGCGGTMARHRANGDKVAVLFIADGVGARNNLFAENLQKRNVKQENQGNQEIRRRFVKENNNLHRKHSIIKINYYYIIYE